jgi:hypothetical protein
MSNMNGRRSSDMKAVCAWALVTHKEFTEYDDSVDVDGVFIDFKDAVATLKTNRLEEENRWIPPVNADKRDEYPFRNKIGELRSSESSGDFFIGWGYSWFSPGGGDTVFSVFPQRTNIWQRSDQRYNESNLSREERQVLKAESDIAYVAGGEDMPEDARFDKESLDLIFDGEEEDDSDES